MEKPGIFSRNITNSSGEEFSDMVETATVCEPADLYRAAVFGTVFMGIFTAVNQTCERKEWEPVFGKNTAHCNLNDSLINGRSMMRKIIKYLAASILTAVIAITLSSCGNADHLDGQEQKEYVYVPEFITVEGEDISYYDMKLSGDSIYYPKWETDGEGEKSCGEFYRYSLADGQLLEIPLEWQEGADNKDIRDFAPAEDGSLYLIVHEKGLVSGLWNLYKFDVLGNQVYSRDISGLLEESGSSSLSSIAIDARGQIYLGSGTLVWLYDAEGEYQGSISMGNSEGWISGMGCGRDGKMYAASYNSSGGSVSLDSMEYTLTELDFEGKQTGAVYEGFPGDDYAPGNERDFLVYHESSVFEYDLAAQKEIPLFDWLDCNINGVFARCLGVLEDGRLVAVYEDWPEEEVGIALLTKKKADQVAQKEELVLAVMTADGSLQSSVVNFNRSSNYHITIKEYYGNDSEISWADAVANLQNDMIAGNCPDMISLTDLNLENLAKKGVFEDLGLYLEKSSVLNREDVLESILSAYTFDGILVGIPYSFSIQTVLGSADKIGERKGWTLEELIAFADAYPDAELFDRASKSSIMQDMMMFNLESFIDWQTGECSFDSDRFKSLLQFVNRYPDEADWSVDSLAAPVRIQNGEVLLAREFATRLDFIQVYKEMFMGDVVCVGYPTMNGSGGHVITSPSQAYAISAESKDKEGAWEFIEGVLTQKESGWSSGFPSVKGKLEVMIRDTLYTGYLLDENGEPLLDENGEMIADADGFDSISFGNGNVIGSSNMGNKWSYTYRTPTQEEIDAVLAVLDAARLVSDNDNEISNIISEEAEPFFKGQKTVEEVANIIQSRVSVYVSENQ